MDFIEVTILRKIFFFLKKVITHKIFVIPLFDEVFPWMKKKYAMNKYHSRAKICEKNWPNPKKNRIWPIFDFFGISDFPGEQI